MATIFTNFSDQVSEVSEHDDHYTYTIKKCPVCFGRKADKPICHAAVGLLQEGLRWVSGGHEFRLYGINDYRSFHSHGDVSP